MGGHIDSTISRLAAGAKRVFGPLEAHTTRLLAASAIGVYLLVVVGATTSLLEAGSACTAWPSCNGGLLPSADPMAVVAWGHRGVGLLVGLLLIVTVGATWVHAERRIRTVVTFAAALYPVQTLLGASLALNGVSEVITLVHLTVAISIFTGILVGLLWRLESETVDPRMTPTPQRETPASSGHTESSQPGRQGPTVPAASPDEEPALATEEFGPTDTTSRFVPVQTDSPADVAFPERVRAYITLTKPRLWWLLALVAVAAMALAAGPALEVGTVVATVAGGVLAIGASGTYNNLLERDRDRQMERTADRPLLDGTIQPWQALVFGIALTVASMAVFVVFVNVLAAALGFLAILFYSVVYTLILKPNTDQNIVIGGAVGAFPALIGWAAVTNTVGVPAIVLGAIVFLWTPAHFYNLALAYKSDYARASFPMLPISRGDALTRRHILLYLGATMAASVTLGTIEGLGWIYATVVVVLGAVFLWAVVRLFHERTEQAAFRTFHAANAYLGLVLVAIVVDAIVLT